MQNAVSDPIYEPKTTNMKLLEKLSSRVSEIDPQKTKLLFYWAPLLITIALLICRANFYHPSDTFIGPQSIPQWVDEYNFDNIPNGHDLTHTAKAKKYILTGAYTENQSVRKARYCSFKSFLIIDMLFILSLFLLFFHYFLNNIKKIKYSAEKEKKLVRAFIILFAIAILSDIAENTIMLLGIGPKWVLSGLSGIKLLSIGLTLLYWIYIIFKASFNKYIKTILKILAASLLSIFIILLIGMALTKMAQGVPLTVELLTSPLNSIIFFILVAGTSVLISHYPNYLYIRLFENDKYTWVMTYKGLPFKYFRRMIYPVIYYNRNRNGNLPSEDNHQNLIVLIRHYLGTLFILILMYGFFYSWNKTHLQIPDGVIFQGFILLGITCFAFQKYLQELSLKVKKGQIKKRKPLQGLIYLHLITFLLFNILLIFRIGIHEWNTINRVLTLVQFILLLISYIGYKEMRSLYKYVFALSPMYSSKERYAGQDVISDDKLLLKRPHVISALKDLELKNENKFAFVGNLSNAIFYLRKVSIFKLITYFTILFYVLSPWIMRINGVNYLLVFILFLYGVIISFMKFSFVYNSSSPSYKIDHNKYDKIPFHTWKSAVGFASVIGLFVALGFFQKGNDYHLLKPIAHDSNKEINRATFINSIDNSAPETPLFAVSAFGGGLKANYNTLLFLNHIDSVTNNKFWNNTISMSGISGGGLGIANYYLMKGEQAINPDYSLGEKIDAIGKLNIVSIDIGHMLSKDLLFSLIPANKFVQDRTNRSERAMNEYRDIIIPESEIETFNTKSYRQIHKEFKDAGTYMPTLIMNTTSTKLDYGIASSVQGLDFPGSINILETPNTVKGKNTLGFYDAVSTVNRFPILSAAAKIENGGHFLDGGYFENSGVLSTISFLNSIDPDWSLKVPITINGQQRKVVILNIINTRTHWLNYMLCEPEKRLREKDASELGSIIKTTTNTEMLPNYFIESLKKQSQVYPDTFQYIPIYIPFKISMEDVESFLDAEPKNYEETMRIISRNNEIIDSLLFMPGSGYKKEWGVVEPALARQLSEPDRIYQKIMIEHHPAIQNQILKIAKMLGINTGKQPFPMSWRECGNSPSRNEDRE